MILISILDYILFAVLGGMTFYLLLFALASLRRRHDPLPSAAQPRRFVILVPAYKEDTVVMDCVKSVLDQDYPTDSFLTVVISDGMKAETVEALRRLSATVIEVNFEKSTKAKALNAALQPLSGFDVAVVLDADNIIEPLFLQKLNAAYHNGASVVQAHRVAKNQNTSLAVLDAVSEEINNSIFRKGHVNLGLSSALIGSGMAFPFDNFRQTMADIFAVGGFDKELEHTYFLKAVKIQYLQDAWIWDEKIQRSVDFTRQRRRWISAQFVYLVRFFPHLPEQIRKGNIDFCNKLFQMALLPRILLVGVIAIIFLILALFIPQLAVKWFVLLMIMVSLLFMAIPRGLYNRKLLNAVLSLPHVFMLTFLAMFKLKGANKKFIHTEHG